MLKKLLVIAVSSALLLSSLPSFAGNPPFFNRS